MQKNTFLILLFSFTSNNFAVTPEDKMYTFDCLRSFLPIFGAVSGISAINSLVYNPEDVISIQSNTFQIACSVGSCIFFLSAYQANKKYKQILREEKNKEEILLNQMQLNLQYYIQQHFPAQQQKPLPRKKIVTPRN